MAKETSVYENDGAVKLLGFVSHRRYRRFKNHFENRKKKEEFKQVYEPDRSLVLQRSVFGGSAWEWNQERHQFYLHQFLKEQPDLNYRNPLVLQEMKVH
jgi:glycosidase